MSKNKYTSEFEVRTTAKVLYPYISTPGGLAGWFADDVIFTPKKNLLFTIDGEDVLARIVSMKANSSVKFEFLDENEEQEDDPSFVEIRLETNELTGTLYVVATEYTDLFESEEEHYDLWEGLVDALCGITGA
jgi:hypothetical protein